MDLCTCFRSFLATCLLLVSAFLTHAESIDFNRDIRPILSDRCFQCHGPDGGNRKAGLRLDTREGALKLTDSGLAAIAPEYPEQSEIIARISSDDADELMPPPESKISLTPAEKETLKKWIKEGAAYDEHWSFRPLTEVTLPEVNPDAPVRTSIDRFVQARLEEQSWSLGEDASKERLIRRVTFDLTGLPPTTEEIDNFLSDTESDAYERLVERLLKSEHHGERLAAEWMDVARYSDSFGYQVDRDRQVWPWRDWVIRAFNENLPYDDFITWQLAGDLLPNATKDQILATTFNRLHSQKVEGGSVPEEFRIEYVADRTHTFGTAFLGLTLECSRCHDHKYDPITQKEYYQFSSFFANIDEAGLYAYFNNSVPTPTLLLPNEKQELEIATNAAAISLAEMAVTAAEPTSVEALSNQVGHFTFDERVDGKLPNEANPDKPADSNNANKLVPGKHRQAISLTGDAAVNLKLGNFSRNQPFSLAWWMKASELSERAVIAHRSRAWTDAASRGYEVLLENGQLRWSLIHFWPGNAISVRAVNPIPLDTWVHVSVTSNGSSRADGLQIFINGKESAVEIVCDQLTKNITGGGGDEIALGERFRDRGFRGGAIDDFRVFERAITQNEAAYLSGQAEKPSVVTAPGTKALRNALKDLRDKRSQLVDSIQEIMVMKETPRPRQSYLLARGAYDAQTDPVSPETPKSLPPMDPDMSKNRLGLAQWLTSPNQPLTARVTVNRYWQMLFGKGLVATPEDFGSQASAPTHPKLLDALAYEFIQSDWDLRDLIRQMVLSQTYRQTSKASSELQIKDPENVWLARAPRYRLAAEMIRDNALAVGGLLVNKLGGPSVKPYEVAASFKPVAHAKDGGLYRRSLYTYWKRTSPAPVMIALDAPKRDVCAVKRANTATPLQAFVYLNDPQAIEAARSLASNLLTEHADNTNTLFTEMFRRMTSRQPKSAEVRVLESMFHEQQDYFSSQPNEAKAYLETGEAPPPKNLPLSKLAAVTVVANSLMAYDDCIMKR